MTDLRTESPAPTGIQPLAPYAWRIAAAAVATMFVSSIYYILLGDVYQSLRGGTEMSTELWPIAAQLGRNLIVATVLAILLVRLRVTTRGAAIKAGALLWLGFQAMAVLGSVIHEGYSLGLYVLHTGDALLTTMIMALIVARKAAP